MTMWLYTYMHTYTHMCVHAHTHREVAVARSACQHNFVDTYPLGLSVTGLGEGIRVETENHMAS